MASQLRDNHSVRGRKGGRRLASSLAALDGLTPRLGRRDSPWLFRPDEVRGGQDEANSVLPGDPGVDARTPPPSVSARTDSTQSDRVPAAPIPADPTEVIGLSEDKKLEILRAVGAALGRAGSARASDVTLAAVEAAIALDPQFRAAIETAEAACVDDCMATIYESGMNGAISASIAYVKLCHDRAAQVEKLRQSKQVVDHVTAQPPPIDTSGLTSAEFSRFEGLTSRLARGERLGPAEAVEYCGLMGKSLAGSGLARAPGQAVDPGGLERLFNIDEGD